MLEDGRKVETDDQYSASRLSLLFLSFKMSSIWAKISYSSSANSQIKYEPKAGTTMKQIEDFFKTEYPCACWRWCPNGDDPSAEGFNVILMRVAYSCPESDDEDDYDSDSDDDDDDSSVSSYEITARD